MIVYLDLILLSIPCVLYIHTLVHFCTATPTHQPFGFVFAFHFAFSYIVIVVNFNAMEIMVFFTESQPKTNETRKEKKRITWKTPHNISLFRQSYFFFVSRFHPFHFFSATFTNIEQILDSSLKCSTNDIMSFAFFSLLAKHCFGFPSVFNEFLFFSFLHWWFLCWFSQLYTSCRCF